MAENMMNKEHKATSDEYRAGYDRIFGKLSGARENSNVDIDGSSDKRTQDGHNENGAGKTTLGGSSRA